MSRHFQALRKARPFVLVVLMMALISSAWAAEKSDWESLSQGKVVVSQHTSAGKVPSVEAKILIARPPEKVWSVVADPEALMSEERKVQRVKVLSQSENKQNVAFSVSMTRLFPPFNYVLLQELLPPNLLRFHRISGSFRDIQGSWKLLPVEHGSKTILTYTLQLDPGPLIPRGLLLGAVKADLPNMMRNAKTAIDKSTR